MLREAIRRRNGGRGDGRAGRSAAPSRGDPPSRHEPAPARELCRRSREVALAHGHPVLAAEAINALAGFDFESGAIESARERFYEALAARRQQRRAPRRASSRISASSPTCRARVAEALAHYQQSLYAFEAVGDDRGRAIAYHNLGMVSADRELWDDADGYFQRSLELAEADRRRPSPRTGPPQPLRGPSRPPALRAGARRTPRRPSPSSTSSAPSSTRPTPTRSSAGSTGRPAAMRWPRPGCVGGRAGGGHRLGAERGRGVPRAGAAVPGDGPEPGGARSAQRGAPAVQPARRPGGPGGCVDQGRPARGDLPRPSCGTGVSRSSPRTATPSATASGWRATRWRWRGRWGSTTSSRPRSGSAPTSTTWAR